MKDFVNTDDRSNNAVLAKTDECMTQVAQRRAHDLHRENRKVNSGASVPAKPAARWYRRFDKR